METDSNVDLEQDFRSAWELFMSQGIEALEEEEIATILFHLYHVDESDYTPEQSRFLQALQSSLEE